MNCKQIDFKRTVWGVCFCQCESGYIRYMFFSLQAVKNDCLTDVPVTAFTNISLHTVITSSHYIPFWDRNSLILNTKSSRHTKSSSLIINTKTC